MRSLSLFVPALTALLVGFSPSAEARQCQTSKYFASTGIAGDRLATAVAVDGNLAVVGMGSSQADSSAYVVDLQTGAELFELTSPPVPWFPGRDQLGSSVAIDGNLAVLGAPIDGENGNFAGAAHLYDVTTGARLAKLQPSNGGPSRFFGQSVGISGNTVIVGSNGQVHLFDATTFQEIGELVPSTFSLAQLPVVAIDGTTAVVSAADGPTPYILAFDTTTLLETQTLPGANRFDIDGNLVVTTNFDELSLFDVTTGALLHEYDIPPGATVSPVQSPDFYTSVAIHGSTIAWGAVEDTGCPCMRGTAYLFDASAPYGLIGEILPQDPAIRSFGFDVDLGANHVVVGSPRTGPANLGAAYLYDYPCSLGTAFCLGVGCPCGNDDPTAGCVNSTGIGGTLSATSGSASLALDAYALEATHGPGNSGLLLINTVADTPIALFDGLNCVRGGPRVLPGGDIGGVQPFGDVDLTGFDGVRNLGAPVGGQGLFGLVNATFPGYVTAGSTYSAQFWFRDVLCGPPPAPCPTPCSTNSNFSNGWTFTVDP